MHYEYTVECPPTQLVNNGTFTGDTTGWTLNGWAYFSDTIENLNNGVTQSLIQSISNLDATNGTVNLTLSVAARDGNNAGGSTADLDIMLGGVVYATINNSSTRASGTNNVTITLFNGATSNFSSFSTNGITGYTTLQNIAINIPYSGASTANLEFRQRSGNDDWQIDNISIFSQLGISCDADGDNIPNYLDLDSDGDGCPDAVEGGDNITQAMLDANSRINVAANGTTTPVVVDAQGIPVITNTGSTYNVDGQAQGQTIGQSAIVNPAVVAGTVSANQSICSGTSPATLTLAGSTGSIQWQSSTDNVTFNNISGATNTTYAPGVLTANTYYRAIISSLGGCTLTTNSVTITVNVCFCYKPAQTSGTTLDTNHGITALGRAGADNSNWPMVRKGAWTVLEAKTKGFVVNRLTDAQVAAIPAANLREGMMVYNITQDCLQINVDGTATGWKCFNTQTCPD